MSDNSPKQPLPERVRDWLHTKGYPLEFSCAANFRRSGFHVNQGRHVKDERTGALREIDVLADQTADVDGALLRLYHVVECKYSQDKPWVVLTSRSGRLAPSACVAQTIGSDSGDLLLWAVAGDKELHDLDHFAIPDRPGFGGRQAFSKGQDQVYSALQSVVSQSTLLARQYDANKSKAAASLDIAAIAFPVVVVNGELFEAFFDESTGGMSVQPANRLRLHWRGAETWRLHATVDIVHSSHLADFAKARASDGKKLMDRLCRSLSDLRISYAGRKLEQYEVTRGPRGRAGRPKLFMELQRELEAGEGMI